MKHRGHSVTLTSEESIRTDTWSQHLRFALHVSEISMVITPSGQTIIDYEITEDTDLSVYHLCNASLLPFLSDTDCYKTGINVSRHLWSDYSLVRVSLPSALRVLCYVYVCIANNNAGILHWLFSSFLLRYSIWIIASVVMCATLL